MAGAFKIFIEGGPWLLLFLATVTDLRSGKIPNLLTFSFLATGLLLRLFSQEGTASFGEGLLGSFTGFGLFFPLYFAGIMAAGDVKLLMALGAWISAGEVFKLAGITIVIGAMVGLFQTILRQGAKSSFKNIIAHLQSSEKKQSTRMPLAPAFFCAFCFLKISEIQGWSF